MKKLFVLAFAAIVVVACNNSNQSSDSSTTDTEVAATEESNEDLIKEYDPHRGEGKFDEIDIDDKINEEKATKGEVIFDAKCSSCHKLSDEMLVGPGFAGVTERRTPVWLMNFLTNTDEMIDLDPELQDQLEICMVRMPDQGLEDDEARALVEFLRKNDGV